jgi:methylglutaconyl-CoA hydratase
LRFASQLEIPQMHAMLCQARRRCATAATGTECLLKIENNVAILTLARPARKNALGRTLRTELQQHLATCAADKAVRCVVLHSAVERVFCAGADLKERKEMSGEEARAFVDSLRATFSQLEDMPVPTIAVVEGAALGGGLELALAADIRIGGEKAKFGVPETALGIIPGAGGTFRLPKLVGMQQAKLMAFTAAPVDAAEALRIGLVAQTAPEGGALEQALAVAAKVAKNGPIAVAAAKVAMEAGFGGSRAAGLACERVGYDKVLGTHDRLEGLKAFAEKRKPVYKGE